MMCGNLRSYINNLYGSFIVKAFQVASLILVYYCFSIGLTFYQKWFIVYFNFPLTVVIFHLLMKFLMSALCRLGYRYYMGTARISLDWPVYIRRVFPVGFTSGLDIGLSNWSLEFITISLYTMGKSTSVVFILMFSFIFKLTKMRWSQLVTVLFIAGGLFMFTYEAVQFNLFGFILVMTASLTSGMRWTLAQAVMQKHEIGLSNPVDMIYHVQPSMILILLIPAAVFEGKNLIESQLFDATSHREQLIILAEILLGGMLAFFLEASEYLLICQTSALTVSIAGVFKEICTLTLAILFKHNAVTGLKVSGMVVCLMGICSHVIMKSVDAKREAAAPSPVRYDELGQEEDSSEDDVFTHEMIRLSPLKEKLPS